jgi:hypothetical protein
MCDLQSSSELPRWVAQVGAGTGAWAGHGQRNGKSKRKEDALTLRISLFKIFNPVFLPESCSWAGFKSKALRRPQLYLQELEASQPQLKSKVPTPPRRRLWFAICHVRVLEPKQIRLKVLVESPSRPRLNRKPVLAMQPEWRLFLPIPDPDDGGFWPWPIGAPCAGRLTAGGGPCRRRECTFNTLPRSCGPT